MTNGIPTIAIGLLTKKFSFRYLFIIRILCILHRWNGKFLRLKFCHSDENFLNMVCYLNVLRLNRLWRYCHILRQKVVEVIQQET